MAAIRLKSGALVLADAIENATYTPDPLLIRTLASFTNAILDSIRTDAQSEDIHGNVELHLDHILRAIHEKYNRTSTADHEALELRASRTTMNQFENL